MTRAVLFDTETTGLDPATGDRVIEIAAIELINDLPTGQKFHVLLNPDRDIPAETTRVHGISNADVEGKPRFADIAERFLSFIGEAPLVAHNAPFDFAFIDAELARLRRPALGAARMIDTLALAKTRFPGMPNSLDALCRRYEIDLSARTTHNALLDCNLLAEVYVELTGGRQRGLVLETPQGLAFARYDRAETRTPRLIVVPPEVLMAHGAFVARLKEPVWRLA